MKLKKDPLKVNFSKQNLTLSVLKYQKKFQIDWTGIARKFPPPPPKKKEKKNVREKLDIGETVLALPERIRKKSAPVKFYKQNVQIFFILTKKKYLS